MIAEAEGTPPLVAERGGEAGLVSHLPQDALGLGGVLESGTEIARIYCDRREVDGSGAVHISVTGLVRHCLNCD